MINIFENDEVLAAEVGRRLKTRRLNQNLTEQGVAEAIGVSVNTYRQLELGQGKISTLIAALRALNALESLDALLPDVPPSPLQVIHRKHRQRGQKSLPAPTRSKSSW